MKQARVKVTYYITFTSEDLDIGESFDVGEETAARRASDLAYDEFMRRVGDPPSEVEVDFVEVD